jgi:PDZ domain
VKAYVMKHKNILFACALLANQLLVSRIYLMAADVPLTQAEVGTAPVWEKAVELGNQAILDRLIDPDSAKIEWPYYLVAGSFKGLFSKKQTGYWTCGLVNSKNRMGGYTGKSYFLIMFKNDTVVDLDIGTNGQIDTASVTCENSIKKNQLIPIPKVEPKSTQLQSAKLKLGINFGAVPDGAYIGSVAAKSPAELAGLRPGMVIEKINGLSLGSLSLTTMQAIFDAANDEIILSVIGVGDVRLRKALMD